RVFAIQRPLCRPVALDCKIPFDVSDFPFVTSSQPHRITICSVATTKGDSNHSSPAGGGILEDHRIGHLRTGSASSATIATLVACYPLTRRVFEELRSAYYRLSQSIVPNLKSCPLIG